MAGLLAKEEANQTPLWMMISTDVHQLPDCLVTKTKVGLLIACPLGRCIQTFNEGGLLVCREQLGEREELVEDWRLLDTRHVRVQAGNDGALLGLEMGNHEDQVTVWILFQVASEIDKGVGRRGHDIWGEYDEPAPDGSAWDCGHGVGGDNTKVIAAALERPEKIAVLAAGGGFDDASVGQDDFVLNHIVAGKTATPREESVTAAEE